MALMALIPAHSRNARSALPVLFAFVLSCMLFYGYSVSSNSGAFRLSNPIGSNHDSPGGGGSSNANPSISVSISVVTLTQTVTPIVAPTTKSRPTPTRTRKLPSGTPRNRRPPTNLDPPLYKPSATDGPPPVVDPFPFMALSDGPPPPIPAYNVPRPNLHEAYGLERMPPLFIGFTRQWPMLLQAVVSYITAGWPPESIHVVENTGVHNSNRDGLLTLQNPFYLNHTTLNRLGVNVVQTPVLLNFAQLQNFYMHEAYENGHDFYWYSHQDVVVFSFEDGPEDVRRRGDRPWEFYDQDDERAAMFPPAMGEPGYRTIYENCLAELQDTLERGERWGMRWYQYDHLTLVNLEAFEAVGGYDSMIPYYNSDCDLNGKLTMDGWSTKFRRVGIINDVSTVMTDLGALYRLPESVPDFADPNPNKGMKVREEKEKQLKAAREAIQKAKDEAAAKNGDEVKDEKAKQTTEANVTQTAKPGPTGKAGGGNTTATHVKPAPHGGLAATVQQDARVKRREEPTAEVVEEEVDEEAAEEEEAAVEEEEVATTEEDPVVVPTDPVEYFQLLNVVGLGMNFYKYREGYKNRNTWQTAQRGGAGEPFYYDGAGFGEAFDVLTSAGREIYKRKWGTTKCNIAKDTALNLNDQWRVEKDWEKKVQDKKEKDKKEQERKQREKQAEEKKKAQQNQTHNQGH
ncbi:hypothetical protein B0T14DRAFT_502835 [Immersiella caudata]|uniref:Uncharacterized protein n=1 Tax=Immersiella caudata TaxID=314043 RepID=A0AA39XDJ5_9PEZI|nr:hypothetical protein B0T14DRAFT_502835 [Immersiella caudata]